MTAPRPDSWVRCYVCGTHTQPQSRSPHRGPVLGQINSLCDNCRAAERAAQRHEAKMEKETAMSRKMSTDRVRFTLTDIGCNRDDTIKAAIVAFNIVPAEAARLYDRSARLIVRPSQFARFIILRGERVPNQAMRQFGAELIEQECEVVDLSTNPRCAV